MYNKHALLSAKSDNYVLTYQFRKLRSDHCLFINPKIQIQEPLTLPFYSFTKDHIIVDNASKEEAKALVAAAFNDAPSR